MLKRKIVHADNNGARAKRRRRKLNMQNIHRTLTELSGKRKRNAYKRRMREGCLNSKIRPALGETRPGLCRCNVECVFVNGIDSRERLDKIGSVAFITRKLRPN